MGDEAPLCGDKSSSVIGLCVSTPADGVSPDPWLLGPQLSSHVGMVHDRSVFV